jgi:hypothetical protein
MDMIRQKCEFFQEKKINVHLKKENNFYNGLIIEVNKDFIILIDRKVGEVPIFFSEIITIEPYKEKEDEEDVISNKE